jgi:signal transduction histidine kinase
MAFASSEFIALCQAQILILTRALNATSTVVYLAEQDSNTVELSLVPLVAYPETIDPWAGLTESLAVMAEQLPPEEMIPGGKAMGHGHATVPHPNGDHEGDGPRSRVLEQPLGVTALPSSQPWATPSRSKTPTPTPPLVLPLVHEGVALGMMVSTRESSAWSRDEQQQAEQVAHSLALAWVLDQRGHWLQQQLQQRHLTQTNQSETFHDLLHQFRNPLTALQTFGRLLVKRIPTDDPNQPIAESIVRESRRLQDLAQTFDDAVAQGDEGLQTPPQVPPVGRLLLPGSEEATADALTSTENAPATDRLNERSNWEHERRDPPRLGRLLQVVPGSMVEVVTPLLQSTQAIAQERGLHVMHDLPVDLPPVWLDGTALAEVLSNLLDNALKYAPPGALIWVTGGLVQQVDDQLCQGLAIGDTGRGIPLVDQPHIFERHFRGVQAEGDIPGTGLGLAIAQELIAAMGGHLELISPVQANRWVTLPSGEFSQGPGTLFMIWLPVV